LRFVDRSIQSFAIGGALGVLSAIPSPFGEGLTSMGKMFSGFAGVGLLIGFVLFYVLPFLPFLYFFFAVGNWVKGIFEAIVAMPLWAVYTILVYMIGMSCFKLIDRIPNEILRWINAEIPSFNDGTPDSAAGLMKYVTIGAERFGGSIGSSLEGIGGGVKQSVQQFMQSK